MYKGVNHSLCRICACNTTKFKSIPMCAVTYSCMCSIQCALGILIMTMSSKCGEQKETSNINCNDMNKFTTIQFFSFLFWEALHFLGTYDNCLESHIDQLHDNLKCMTYPKMVKPIGTTQNPRHNKDHECSGSQPPLRHLSLHCPLGTCVIM